MTLLFLSLAVIIAIIVILVSAKHIKIVLQGFEARSEVKEQQRNENVSQEDEEILDKLKDKNLSPEDLKKIYEDLQKKK